jgi:hypothetical protein
MCCIEHTRSDILRTNFYNRHTLTEIHEAIVQQQRLSRVFYNVQYIIFSPMTLQPNFGPWPPP